MRFQGEFKQFNLKSRLEIQNGCAGGVGEAESCKKSALGGRAGDWGLFVRISGRKALFLLLLSLKRRMVRFGQPKYALRAGTWCKHSVVVDTFGPKIEIPKSASQTKCDPPREQGEFRRIIDILLVAWLPLFILLGILPGWTWMYSTKQQLNNRSWPFFDL